MGLEPDDKTCVKCITFCIAMIMIVHTSWIFNTLIILYALYHSGMMSCPIFEPNITYSSDENVLPYSFGFVFLYMNKKLKHNMFSYLQISPDNSP